MPSKKVSSKFRSKFKMIQGDSQDLDSGAYGGARKGAGRKKKKKGRGRKKGSVW